MTKKINFLTSCITLIIFSMIMTACSISSANAEITNSDEDFSEAYAEPTLNDGRFYFNSNPESCYFSVNNGNIQLVFENDNQMQELFDLTTEHNRFEFDEWRDRLKEDWNTPKPYIVHTTISGNVNVGWDVVYDDNGNITGYLLARYVDKDNFDYINCRFTRILHSQTNDNNEKIKNSDLYQTNSNGQTYGCAETTSFEQIPDLIRALGKNGTEAYMRKEDFLGENTEKYEVYTVKVTGDELEFVREQYKDQYPDITDITIVDFYKKCFDIPLFDESGEKEVDQFTVNVDYYPYPY